MEMDRKRILRDGLYIALGIFLIIALLLRADISETVDRISSIDLKIVLLVFALYCANLCVKVLRWWTLLRAMGIKRTGPSIAPIFLASLALNNSTPGKIGGEPVRALLLKEHSGAPLSSSAASIFAEKSLDMLTILGFSLAGIVFLVIELGLDEVKGMAIGIVIGGVVIAGGIAMLSSRRIMKVLIEGGGNKAVSMLRGPLKDRTSRLVLKATRALEKFHSSVHMFIKDKGYATASILLTIEIWLNEGFRLYLILLAMPGGGDVPFIGALAAIGVGNILGFILPIGSGNVLGGTSVLYLLTGEEELSTAASITAVALSLWISIPMGLVSLLYLRKRTHRRSRDGEGSDEEE